MEDRAGGDAAIRALSRKFEHAGLFTELTKAHVYIVAVSWQFAVTAFIVAVFI